jgi:hypothetical protein
VRLSSLAVVELIRPVGLCLAAVLVTTSVLSTIVSFVPTEHLMLGYLLPCIRLRPQQRNHVWSYDFVEDRTHEGRKYRMLNVLDEFTHECLAIRVARKLKAIDVTSRAYLINGAPTRSAGGLWRAANMMIRPRCVAAGGKIASRSSVSSTSSP